MFDDKLDKSVGGAQSVLGSQPPRLMAEESVVPSDPRGHGQK